MTVLVLRDIFWDEGRHGACPDIVFPYDHER